MKMNKKGAEGVSLLGTVAALVLIVLVLVLLIFAATGQFGGFKKFIGNVFGGSKDDVKSTVLGCQVACLSGEAGTNDYCKERTIVFEDGKDGEKMNCKGLESRSVGLESCDEIICASDGEAPLAESPSP